MFIKRFLHITSTLQIIFCTSTISSLFIIFLFKQFYKIQTLDFSGIELGSLEKRVSMLTTWPAPPRPSCPLFQLGKIFYHVSQLFFSRSLFKNWPTPAPFRIIFCLFNQTIQFLQQNIVKNVNPVSGTRIWTHNLLIMSLLPLPLDQGSAPPRSLSFVLEMETIKDVIIGVKVGADQCDQMTNLSFNIWQVRTKKICPIT